MRSHPVLLLAVVVLISLSETCFSQSEERRRRALIERTLAEAGTIEGAIWVYELTPAPKSPKRTSSIRGAYRVHDLKIYQAAEPRGEMTKLIGVSQPGEKGKRTRIDFTALRGRLGPGEWVKPMKGKAFLAAQKFGDGKGFFIDQDGLRWQMRTLRIRE